MWHLIKFITQCGAPQKNRYRASCIHVSYLAGQQTWQWEINTAVNPRVGFNAGGQIGSSRISLESISGRLWTIRIRSNLSTEYLQNMCQISNKLLGPPTEYLQNRVNWVRLIIGFTALASYKVLQWTSETPIGSCPYPLYQKKTPLVICYRTML